MKEGSTKVTIENEKLKQIYTIEVVKAKELKVECLSEMNVGDKVTLDVTCDGEKIENYEVFIDNTDVLSFKDNELVGIKKGKANVTVVAKVGDKTLNTTFVITVKEEALLFDGELVVNFSDIIYANQTSSYEVKMSDGTVVDDYEVIVDDDELIEFYPEDSEYTTLDVGVVKVTFKAVIGDKVYGKEYELDIKPALFLDIRVSDVITTKEAIKIEVYVMPDEVKLEEYVASSGDIKIFTIDNDELTPVSVGRALLIISSTYNGAIVSGTKQITVKEYVADYIDTNIDIFLILYDELNVAVRILPNNDTISNLEITSSDSSVIEVNDNKLFGKKTGSSKITVKANGLEKEYDVDVIEVTSIELVASDKIYLHEVMPYEVIAKPSNTKINDSYVDLVVHVYSLNLLVNDRAMYAVGPRTGVVHVSITLKYHKNAGDAQYSHLVASKDITVYEEEKKIERVELSCFNAFFVGSVNWVNCTKYPADGVGEIEYSSSDESIIKIEGNEITALKEGRCYITVSVVGNESVSDTKEIVVKNKKEVEVVSDGLYNGGPMTARYQELYISRYYELMCGVTETTYYGETSTQLGGDVDGYSGMTGEIEPDKFYVQQVHVLEVPSRKDVFVVPWANLNGHKWTLTTVKGLIENYEKNNPGYKVIAAVNGDFFDINANKNLPYSTTGENISNGEFYKVSNGFSHIGGTIGFTNDGSNLTLVAGANTGQKYTDYFVLDVYDENGNIIKSFHINSFNDPTSSSDSCLYFGTYNDNKDYVPITPSGSNTFMIESAMLALPSDTYDFYGKGVITSTESKELGVGDFAITTSNTELMEYLKVGALVRVQRVFTGDFAGVTSATGYNGVIYDENGIFDFYANGNLSNRAPRTVIGMKADGTLVMMVVDGRQGARNMYGCDGYELTAIMRAYGCIKAYNVDGGGSSTIVVRADGGLKVLNSPSDGHERSDGNCILICTVDPDYQATVSDIKSDSAVITVATNNEAFKDYDTYVEINGKLMKTENGKIQVTNLIHNNNYAYRVYFEKDGEKIPTQTIGNFTTCKSGFEFLGLFINPSTDRYYIEAYSLDDDHGGNVSEMVVTINGKNVILKNGTAEALMTVYGSTIEKLSYEYWYNDENGRNIVTVIDGLDSDKVFYYER